MSLHHVAARRGAVLGVTMCLCLVTRVIAGEDDAVFLQDTLVVRATKSTQRLSELATTATLVSSQQVRLGTARSVQDVLAPVPGVHLLDLGGSEAGGTVEARGFAAQGTTSPMIVLVDELPINDLETGRVDWSLLAQPQVDHVEFLRGPVSFSHGTAAMAGLVNLVTVPPRQGRTAWIETGGGSGGRANSAGGVSWGGERAKGAVSGSFQRLDGFRDNGAWRSAGGYAITRLALGQRWSGRARLFANDGLQHVPGPLPDSLWRTHPERSITPEDRRGSRTWGAALELSGVLTPRLETTTLGSIGMTRVDATETILPLGALDRTSHAGSGRAETRFHWTPYGRSTPDLLVGGELRIGRLDSRYLDPDAGSLLSKGKVRRSSGALFALGRLPLRNSLTLVAGGRLDWLRSSLEKPLDSGTRGPNHDLRAWSPTAGISWTLPRAGHAWISYAGAFKAPELDQLYDQRPYDLGFGVFQISNGMLKPQRGDHWDGGVRAPLGSGFWLNAAAYHILSRNEIGFDLANFRLSNITRSRHTGVEADVSMLPVRGVSGSLSYAYTRATFDGGRHDGKQINTVPEQQLFSRVSWEHHWNGSLTAELGFTGRQWIDEDEHYRLPSATVLHVSATQVAGPVELFSSVRNMTNKRYASVGYVTVNEVGQDLPLYFPAAGRTFLLGVRMRVTGR